MNSSKSNVVTIQKSKSVNVTAKKPSSVPVRVSLDTKKRITSLLSRINKERIGKKVKPSELIDHALQLLTETQLKEIGEKSLSNRDRMELLFKQATKSKRNLSRDEFLGLLIEGKLTK